MEYFDGVKVGDRVESLIHGEGVVKSTTYTEDYPLYVFFNNGMVLAFTFDGVYYPNQSQTLFWPGVKVIPSERPKRMVERQVTLWVNVYPNCVTDHSSEEKARRVASPKAIATAVLCTGTYMLEGE